MNKTQEALVNAIREWVAVVDGIPVGSIACEDTTDQLYTTNFKPVMEILERNGWWMYPAASVVSPEDRAAVGRLAAFCDRQWQAAMNDLRSTEMAHPSWMRKSKDLEIIESAFGGGDIEAARRVAEEGE